MEETPQSKYKKVTILELDKDKEKDGYHKEMKERVF